MLEEVEQRHEALKRHGMCDEGAHNAAWEELDFEDQYRSHLLETPAAREAVDDFVERLRAGESLVLVCFENTDQKRCHRTLLRTHIDTRLEDA